MSEKPRKMILIKDGIDLDIFDDKNMSDRVLMLNYPEGTVIEQLHKFYKLIGKECENVEIVHPKRLYTLTEEQYPVMMLVDKSICIIKQRRSIQLRHIYMKQMFMGIRSMEMF